MHFSTIAAAALALAPIALCAEPVAQIKVNGHEGCKSGVVPTDGLPKVMLDHAYATKDHCEKVKVSHDMNIDSYSVTVDTITHDTNMKCVGVGVYANDLCTGEPAVAVPWHATKSQVKSQCFSPLPFDENKYMSFKLFCYENKAEAQGNEDVLAAAAGAKASA
ncbi:hypothetical protein FE257_011553 [Aspergillus nanangensis]|uniref:Uncharacterized protein n=1 Tax=Aspergillus nanangensis TaxID=2582783 RepID=A0AAD4CH01_ASPNN|nr:hypothetical protein FE257_011553 [Aspergillus nanangensis]